LEKYRIDWKKNDSFVIIENDRAYQKSSAALQVCNRLPWYWKWTQIFWIFPRFIRDGIYIFIARNRYSWFGKREECMVPTPAIRKRFLE
jgi:predicted DCC family thiol-disulfide oxidoreductase YuxK